ncbi:MAG: glycosyltransferase [Verrucomicrobiae bacterium]|nr:glycosyltransferase [Verrucomicrobiae bacterium]
MKIVFLDLNCETPMPPFFQEAFESLGHEVATVFAAGAAPEQLERDLDCGAKLILAVHNTAFLAGETLASPRLAGAKKAVLYYDDPMNGYTLFGRRHPLVSRWREMGAVHFIWDGYWRRKMKDVAGWDSFATHLAAEPNRFSPEKSPAIPGIGHCVVFLGNIPSLESIQADQGALPEPYRQAARLFCGKMAKGVYGLNPFEAMEEVVGELPPPAKTQIHEETESWLNGAVDLRRSIPPHVQLRRLAWNFGKRITRLRALRAVSRVAPAAILSNLKLSGVAGRDELLQEMGGGKGHDLLFVDSSQASYYQLAHLYRSGLVHFQTTDPQSVDGGIPYRVFQCAACAVPLISDAKKELLECFEPDREMIYFNREDEIAGVVERALGNRASLRDVGMAAYERYKREHTWIHRATDILLRTGCLG